MFKHVLYWLVLLIPWSVHVCAGEIVVVLPDGKIKGSVKRTLTNKTFYSFQGIPYAEPPLGDLRFLATQQFQPWEDIVDATYEKNICYQVTIDTPNESEDCLFINVFTPWDLSSGTTLPVMVFIHGGGFMDGSSESASYGPEHFMEYDVILVTFNYRLGPFGFLSSNDSVISGNAGLKDQNLALQWVSKNIHLFGGDPEKVTIFGQDAGAASVVYHILSPKSKGLFRAAICLSGSAISPWAYQIDEKDMSYYFAGLIDDMYSENYGTSMDLLNYLRTVPIDLLDAASFRLYKMEEGPQYLEIQQGYFFAPVIEYWNKDGFITELMYETLKEGNFNQVPIIIGITSEESIFFTDDEDYLKNISQVFDHDPTLMDPLDMKIKGMENLTNTAEVIKNLYSPNGTFEDNPLTVVSYLSDQSFVRSEIKHAELQSQFTDVYFYQFSYSGVLGGQVSEPVEGSSEFVRHGEELNYLFTRNSDGYNTTDISKFPERDVLVSKRFITMLTNFAKTLNPTPENDELLQNVTWPKVNDSNFPYLDIGSDLEIRLHPRNKTYGPWQNIYDEYGVPPYYTY